MNGGIEMSRGPRLLCNLCLCVCALSAGCSKSESPLSFLESVNPVSSETFRLETCSINGKSMIQHDGTSSVSVARDSDLEIAGRFADGDWKIETCADFWIPRDNEQQGPVTMAVSPHQAILFAFLYGEPNQARAVAAESAQLENRPDPEDESHREFRARLTSPSMPGVYVLDLHAVRQDPGGADVAAVETELRPPGVPFGRYIVHVQ